MKVPRESISDHLSVSGLAISKKRRSGKWAKRTKWAKWIFSEAPLFGEYRRETCYRLCGFLRLSWEIDCLEGCLEDCRADWNLWADFPQHGFSEQVACFGGEVAWRWRCWLSRWMSPPSVLKRRKRGPFSSPDWTLRWGFLKRLFCRSTFPRPPWV